MLIGIVKKNAIMMIDFALEAERTHGKDAEAAIYEASLVRFRPIMMTTMCALLGALPIAMGLGAGAESRRPLGLAVVGGLLVSQVLTLALFNSELNLYSMVGLIMLIGIVKKNAIMMIDFALDAQRQGMPAALAIYEASIKRFRPIMMTTMAALLGAIPLALGTGAGSELRSPLGIAIFGGLLLSQFLTLFTTPVIYVALDGLRERTRIRFARRIATAGE